MRYADHLGDFITDQYYANEKAASEHDLAELHAIDRAALNATDQLAYDVFEFNTQDTLRGYQPDLLSLTIVRPMNHFFGFHTFYPTFASGKGAAPFKTVEDYENNLKRHKEYRDLSRPRHRPVPRGRGKRGGRDQDDRPQHDRAARYAAQAVDRGVALLRAGQAIPGHHVRGGPDAAHRRLSRRDRRRDLSGDHPVARLPEDRISAARPRRHGPDVHEGRRQALPLPGPVDDDPPADP